MASTVGHIAESSAIRPLPAEDESLISDDELLENEATDTSDRRKLIPAWILSIVAHAVILACLALIYVATTTEKDEPATQIVALPPPPPEEQPKVERDITTTEVTLDVEVISETPSPISELDVPVETFEREEETDAAVAKGREEATADSEMGGSGAFMAIGAGGGAAGMFGSRSGGGKKRALGKYGGNRASESAVDGALRWFKRHQSPNGMWDVDGYPANCQEQPKCEPGGGWPGVATMEQADLACTAYAVLCFLGAGYDHRMPSNYKITVSRGIDWLLAQQKADGLWGERNYEHAIVTMAVAEAYAMSNDNRLKGPAQKATDIILSRQAIGKDGYPTAWDYTVPNIRRIDSSVSGWNVMALKSAAAGGLNIHNGMEGAKNWLTACWKDHNADWANLDPYTGESTFPYTWNAEGGKVDGFAADRDLSCVAALCAVFLGHKSGDIMLETLSNHIMNTQFPKSYPTNTYFMYYNTLAIFQVGGDRWERWNGTVRDVLVKSQRVNDGCFDGSWDSKGTEFVGYQVGRLLSTAYCCLSLEVYYRYVPVGEKH